ncbi:MAG: hypothetical protein O7F08_12915, partial [Deltaproteobacteria bacterium]|nr:hypothetical protein [Deltaproteobacteria bacterium]
MAFRAARRSRASWPFALLLAMLVGGCEPPPSFTCTDAIGCVEIPPESPIKLGSLITNGIEAPQGIDGTRAARHESYIGRELPIELALEDWDHQILGHPIHLLSEDSVCGDGAGAIAALKFAADSDVVAILSAGCSAAEVPAARIMSEGGLSMISGTATLPSLTFVAGVQGADSQP